MVNGQNQGAQKQKETERERDPISEGLSPLHRHGGDGIEGKPFSHLGGRSRKNKKKGGSLPLPRWRWNTGRAIIVTAIYTNNFTAIITNSPPIYAAV